MPAPDSCPCRWHNVRRLDAPSYNIRFPRVPKSCGCNCLTMDHFSPVMSNFRLLYDSSPPSSLQLAAIPAPGRRATRTWYTRFDYVNTRWKHHSTEGGLRPFATSSPPLQDVLNRHAKFVEAHPDENEPKVSIIILGIDQSHA